MHDRIAPSRRRETPMPARAMWKGLIEFDGVATPVKLYAAIEDRGVHFNLLHDQDMVRLRQRMVNAITGNEVEPTDMRKGYEVEPGRFVLVHQEELDALEPAESRTIDVVQCVDPVEVGQQWYDRPYYLGPDGNAERYWALVDALEKQKKIAIVRWVMRKKQYTGAIRVERDALMLITLRSPAELIDPREVPRPAGRKLDSRELRMAEQLISALEGEFNPADFRNVYIDRVRDLVERKAKGQKVDLPKPREFKPRRESLESMLRASIDAAKREKKKVRAHA